MKPILKNNQNRDISLEDEDPKGPMMVWNGPRSEEDVQFMSNWVMARKAELAKEKAHLAGKAK